MATDTREDLILRCSVCGKRLRPRDGWFCNTKECVTCHEKNEASSRWYSRKSQ